MQTLENLQSGDYFSLMQGGKPPSLLRIGINWGMISEKTFFGLVNKRETVDLDVSVILMNERREIIDHVYYGKLESRDGAIKHTGDDMVGDKKGDDGLDNETLMLKISKLNPEVYIIYFILNNFKEQKFSDLPYAKISIRHQHQGQQSELLADFNLSQQEGFANASALVLAKITREVGERWFFHALGEKMPSAQLPQIIEEIRSREL